MKSANPSLWLRLTTVASLSASFFVVLTFFIFSMNLQNLLTLWGEDIQITAYLKADLSKAEVQTLIEKLRADSRSARVEWVDQQKALRDFQVQLSSYAPDLAQDQEILSLVPQSLQIQLHETLQNKADVESFAQDINKIKGIEEVRFGQEWIKQYSALVGALRKVFALGVVIILAAAFLVVGNAVRASIEGRRREIEVLELVGASTSMIRRPFLVEGALLSIASMVIALGLSFGVFAAIAHFLSEELQSTMLSSSLHFLSGLAMFGFVALSAGLGAFSAYVCIRKINTGFAASGARS